MATGCGAFDGDTSTVHIHFSVADQIEPSPTEEDIGGRGGVCRNGEIVLQSDRASTDHGLDDFPSVAVVV